MPNKGRESGQSGLVYAKLLDVMPDYSTEAIKAIENQLGEFVPDEDVSAYGADLITRGPYELDSMSVYKGQWSKEGLR